MVARVNGRWAAYGCLAGVHASSPERPRSGYRACAAPDGMRHGAPEPPLAPHAGAHGGATPRAGWRGWPRPRVRGAQPREQHASASRRCKHRERRGTSPRCMVRVDPSGLRPSGSPLGRPDGSPDPSAGDLVGLRIRGGACLRCEACIGACGEWIGTSARLVLRFLVLRLFASSLCA
jgi:hypothetical protein